MPKGKRIKNELEMAMIVATHFWCGSTSMVEGAIAIMEQVRRTHPEQFADEKREKG